VVIDVFPDINNLQCADLGSVQPKTHIACIQVRSRAGNRIEGRSPHSINTPTAETDLCPHLSKRSTYLLMAALTCLCNLKEKTNKLSKSNENNIREICGVRTATV